MPNKVLNNITSVYTDKSINGWVRGLIWVGTIVVVYVAGKAIYGKLFPSSEEIAQKEREKQLEDDINTAKQTQTPSFLATQYNRDADSIVAAFSGCDPTMSIAILGVLTTSGVTVKDILNSYKNDLDVLLLQKAFGTRTITKSWICMGDYTNVDLSAAITNQLNSSEIAYLNNLLASKGITKVKF